MLPSLRILAVGSWCWGIDRVKHFRKHRPLLTMVVSPNSRTTTLSDTRGSARLLRIQNLKIPSTTCHEAIATSVSVCGTNRKVGNCGANTRCVAMLFPRLARDAAIEAAGVGEEKGRLPRDWRTDGCASGLLNSKL